MDLSPREVVPTAVGKPRKRPIAAFVVLALVLAAGAVMVGKFLTSAVDYYCNVDEVGVRSGCNGERRIRIQGVVKKDSLSRFDGTTTFVMEWNKKDVKVSYLGDPGGIFQECIPVVVRGRALADGSALVFEGDEVIVKHDNTYDAENKDRMQQANTEAATCSQKG